MRQDYDFTDKEIERQDDVDNTIQDMLEELGLCEGAGMKWDMSHIGAVRDVVQEIIVDELGIMSEDEFYPYRDMTPFSEPQPRIITDIDEGSLFDIMVDELRSQDSDDLAVFAGQLLGGTCTYNYENGTYHFESNYLYSGALGSWID